MAKNPQKKIVTKKHLARIERERIQIRYILIVSILVLVSVAGMIIYGILEQSVLIPRQPVARVENESITTHEFQTTVRYARLQLVEQYMQTYQFAQFFGEDANTLAYFQNNLSQIEFQLETTTMGQSVLNSLIEDRLIRSEAASRGISVSADEIEQALQTYLGYYPEGTPTPKPTSEPQPTSTLSPFQQTLAAPPPTAVITTTPTITESTAITESETIEATPTLTDAPTSTPAATSTPLPTATPYTESAYLENLKTLGENLKANLDLTEKDLRRILESQLYREKVRNAVLGDLPMTQEQVWARHILVEDEVTASELYDRLSAGEDFATLAMDYSMDPGSGVIGGDLGWFGRGMMVPEFEITAFDLEIGEIGQPVQSQFGWHIIQALGHEERPVSEAEIEQTRLERFQEWLDERRQTANVEILDYWIERIPVEPTIPPLG